MQVHKMDPAAGATAPVATGWAATALQPAAAALPRLFAHDLPTRVAAISWLHTPSALLLGVADTKVCVWSPGG